MSKFFTKRRVITLIVIIVLVWAGIYAGKRLPIITGYAAKGMCSCVFVADRDPASVEQNDLNFFPINLAKTNINYDEKYVTSTLFGLVKRKAVYHEGYGGTLVENTSDESLTVPPDDFKKMESGYDTIAWPSGERLTNSVPARVNISLLKEAVDSAFDIPGKEKIKQTAAVVVVYKNQLIAEKYTDGFTAETPGLGWSMSKSLTSALVGVLVKEGKLDINAAAPVKEWANDNRSHITLNNLLHMNSGLAWTENYFNLSDVTKMLYKSDDMYNYAIQAKYEYPPDSVWFYSSGTANIVAGIIRNAFADEQAYHNFPYQALFNPVGMQSMVLEPDASGTFVGSSYSFATARDWARFGLLYLHDGVWQGKRILPEGWVKYTTTPAKGSDGTYGAFFWLNKDKTLPDVPEDMFYCDGFKGQRVFVIPSKDLVIVRLGFSSTGLNFNRFVSSVIEALPAE